MEYTKYQYNVKLCDILYYAKWNVLASMIYVNELVTRL